MQLDKNTGIKLCSNRKRGCTETNPAAYGLSRFTYDGLNGYCKVCATLRVKIRYSKNNKNIASYLYERSQTLEGRARVLCNSSKVRAKRNGVPFTITKEFILDLLEKAQDCPYLGIPIWRKNDDGTIQWFTEKKKKGGFQPNSPSLDQIIAGKGYTEENVELVSYRANSLKYDASFEELIAMGERSRKLLQHMEAS